eukprot:TRINITY_DN35442_c0_g1_i1.p3 TRINITY_DN35442_c0_g1~~TRINITY_DN35442_c0_g1_i1.p3  ORF type:complete len:129 (-),score=15.29 TRINITY_DN35442_c0_g1_i1:289-675(-)
MKHAARAKIQKPFQTSFYQKGRLFWQNPEKDPPMPPKKQEQQGKEKQFKIWKPSHPAKKGRAYASLSQVGLDHEPDPVKEAAFKKSTEGESVKAFKPPQYPKKRLSMWAVNHYATSARAPPNLDFTLL